MEELSVEVRGKIYYNVERIMGLYVKQKGHSYDENWYVDKWW